MKTLLVTIVVIGMALYQVSAQSVQSITLGPKIGLNVSSWSGDDFNTDSKTGINIGAFSIIKFSEKFSLQPELLYSGQGTICGCRGSKIPVNYLILPILAKVDVYKNLYLNAGPQIGFLLSAKDGEDTSAEDEFSSTDFGIAIGAGYALPMRLHFHLRYIFGLSNINSEDFDENTQSRVFQVSVGYLLWKKNYN